MVIESHTDLQGFVCICPVEYACLLREDLEGTLLLALWLHYVERVESAIDHQVSRLEAN